MAGFQKNVTQTHAEPPAARQPEVARFADLGTSFGEMAGTIVRETKEARRKNRESELLGEAQRMVRTRDEALAQDPKSGAKLNLQVQRDIATLGRTPEERDFLRRAVNQAQGANISSLTRSAIDEQSKRSDSLLMDALGTDLGKAMVTPEIIDGSASQEDLNRWVIDYNKAVVQQEQAKLNNQQIQAEASVNSKKAADSWEGMASNFNQLLTAQEAQLRSSLASVEQLPSADKADQIARIKNNMVSNIQLYRQKIFSSSGAVRKNMTAAEAKEFDKRVKLYMDQADTVIQGLDKLKDDEVKRVADYLGVAKKNLGIDALQAAEGLFRMRETVGDQAVGSMINAVIQGDPEFLEAFRGQVTKELAAGFTDSQRSAMQMKSMISFFEGSSILDIADPEERADKAKSFYSASGKLIIDGSILTAPDNARSSAAVNLANVLDMAQEGADISQMKRATDLINHPNYRKFYESLDATDKKIIGQYSVTFNQDVMQDRNLGLVRQMGAYPDQISYNADSGKYEFKPKAVPQGQVGGLLGGAKNAEIAARKDNQEAKRLVKEANGALQSMWEYKENDPYLADKSYKEMSNFVHASTGIKAGGRLGTTVPVQGSMTTFDEQDIEAQEKGMTKDKMLELMDEQDSLDKLENLVRQTTIELGKAGQSPQTREELGKLLAPQQQTVDTSDMSDEEFEEMVKQMRAARGKR